MALPVKSHSTKSEPRSTSAISKREDFQQHQEMEVETAPPKPCYDGYQDFTQRVKKLKLSIGWDVIDYIDFIEAKYNEPNSQFLVPKYQVFINPALGYVLRCYGWTIPTNADVIQCFPSFNVITLSDFIKSLDSYKICQGIILFKSANLYNRPFFKEDTLLNN